MSESLEFEEGQNEERAIPESLEFTSEDAKAARKSLPLLREGWLLAEITSRSNLVAKTGTFTTRLMFSPVNEEGEVQRHLKVRLDMYIPKANPAVVGHKPPNTLFGCYMTLLALDDTTPKYPRKLKDGVYELPDGSVCGIDKASPVYAEVDNAIGRAACSVFSDRQAFLGKRCYICVEHEQGRDGKTYCRVSKTRAGAPDEPVITADFVQAQDA